MPKYRILVHGKNFLLMLDAEPRKVGFYQNIYVEASDPADAELEAARIVRESDLRQKAMNLDGDPPMSYVEEMPLMEPFDHLESLEQGTIFYPMDQEDSQYMIQKGGDNWCTRPSDVLDRDVCRQTTDSNRSHS